MNLEDAAKLLTVVASVDGRLPREDAVFVWADILGDVTLDEAMDALRVFRRDQPGTYLEPGHIYQIVKAKRREARATDNGINRPPAPDGRRYAVDVIEMGELE